MVQQLLVGPKALIIYISFTVPHMVKTQSTMQQNIKHSCKKICKFKEQHIKYDYLQKTGIT